jgi:predicted amidohydrolase YtcJ
MITIFHARSILTMNPGQDRATHVAVRDGKILAVGMKEDAAKWIEAWPADTKLDERFADQVLMPGFVEGHSHLMEGLMWDYIYVGFYDRMGPDGKVWSGLKTIEAVTTRLKEFDDARDDKSAPIIAWGFDPIFFGDRRLNRDDLDAVSTQCPALILHSSLHIVNTNSFIINEAGVDANNNSEFIRRNDDGQPTGEFLGQVGLFMAMRATGLDLLAAFSKPHVLENFASVAQRAGVTTATDLANSLPEDAVKGLCAATERREFPVRLVIAYSGNAAEAEDGIKRLKEVAPLQNDKLRMNIVKLVGDGSIQGFSARLKWPGYENGSPNGLWYIEPDRLNKLILDYNKAGIQIHVHANGDETIDAVLNAFEAALSAHSHPDHRHTLQHCQMADRAQFKRMKALGLGVNLFSNHIFYWGDAHIEQTMGRDRANRLDDAGAALAEGIPLAIHSDAPVTAIGPLFTAWCAVNRVTSTGQRLGGDAQRISVDEALEAITLGAAYSLKMDSEIGSIEIGKLADFAVLSHNPKDEEPEKLKDISVVATVVGGHVFMNDTSSD